MSGPASTLVWLGLLPGCEAVALDFLTPPDISTKFPRPFLYGIVGICFFAWVVYRTWIYPFLLSPLRYLPEPKGGLPIIGHMHLRVARPVGEEPLKWIQEHPDADLIRLRGFLNSEALCMIGPQAIAEVLVTKNYDFIKPPKAAGFLARVLGNGLVVVEGDVHKLQRKHIQPSFNFRHIKELYPIFWRKSVDVVKRIRADLVDEASKTPPGVSELSFWAPKVTLDLIGIAGIGRDFHTVISNEDELAQTYEKIMEPRFEIFLLFSLTVLGARWALKLLPTDARNVDRWFTLQTDKLRDLCRQLVVEKKRWMKATGEDSADLLSKLIQSNNFSDNELVDQVLTFLAAGHETTSSTFEWATYLLARHPEIQSRLRAEIRDHLPYGISANLKDVDLGEILESMPFLNGVCSETFRLYPTVAQTLRVAARDTSIMGYPIPKDTLIAVPIYGLNRSPKLWGPDSESFDPSRWIDKDTGKSNNSGGADGNYSFMTFLHGPRSCIGQGFARAELRALIAAFVGAFEMELEDDSYRPIRTGVVTTKPSKGMPLKLKVVGEWSKAH
ncbi:cytochrome P450 3A4 [Exophiala viscosa]|uniref:Cytochrome P450 3A4 n=1 Tax=Exophiala viscosa TaxID=2486360 RepID=A0AAN6IIV2_9EURO|nr:cytochrome P450 3A4 [Exophiala viscosa]